MRSETRSFGGTCHQERWTTARWEAVQTRGFRRLTGVWTQQCRKSWPAKRCLFPLIRRHIVGRFDCHRHAAAELQRRLLRCLCHLAGVWLLLTYQLLAG